MTYEAAALRRAQEAMREGYDRLIAFAGTPEFQALVQELFALPKRERPGFVKRVVLSDRERRKRGLRTPEGVMFQRSSFGDRRPTLFCIKTWLPKGLAVPWQNVNVTVDDVYDDGDVPRDGRAWRVALDFDQQAEMLARGMSAREIVEA